MKSVELSRLALSRRVRFPTDVVDEDVDVLEVVWDPVEEALDGVPVLHVEGEAFDPAALSGRAFLVGLQRGLFDFFELSLAARGQDEGCSGAGERDGLTRRWSGKD